MTLLEVRDLTVRFGRLCALDGVSLDVEEGSLTGLIGPNGAGKSTLLDAVSGLLPVAAGSVRFAGRPLGRLPSHRRAGIGLARTFQSLALAGDLTVGENLLVAAEATEGRTAASATARVERVASRLSLDELLDRPPVALAPFQRTRVALARAAVVEPLLMLLDEPSAGLDAGERRQLAGHLRELAGEGVAVVLVEHDMGLVKQVCDRVYALDFGRVIASGPPSAVMADQQVVAAYLGKGPGPAPADTRPTAGGRHGDGPPAVSAVGLSVHRAGIPVLHEVDLSVSAGEVAVLLGPNGAGKTSALLAVAGVLPAAAGQLSVLGAPVNGRPGTVARRGVASVFQEPVVFGSLTVAENLRLAAGRRRVDLDQALEPFPALRPALSRSAALLSGGERQMLGLARALLRRPRLLLVDEMSLGLAPRVVSELMGTLRRLASEHGTAVLLAEQHVHLAPAVADTAHVLVKGRVVAAGPAGELASRPEVLEATYLGTGWSAAAT